MTRRDILRVGLTGGIGCGKSTVAATLARCGAVVVDADLLAREAVAAGTPGFAQVVHAFGEGVVGPDGALDRGALGRLVFADEDRLRALEAIVHPVVRRLAQAAETAAPPGSIVVHEQPLLVESRLAAAATSDADADAEQAAAEAGDDRWGHFDAVVVVDCPPPAQLHRLVSLRGMAASDARARMAAQASRGQRLAVADFVVTNDSTPEELTARTKQLYGRLEALRAARLAGAE